MKAEYVDHMGTDLSTVNAAKVSFASRSTEIGEKEKSLIKYLATGVTADERQARSVAIAHMTNEEDIESLVRDLQMQAVHWTPFSHTAITLRVGAPVPIRTQCFKHKIGFIENEESRRYISSRPELYIPPEFRSKADKKKQGSGGKHPHSDVWVGQYEKICNQAIDTYELMLQDGVCPEQARFILPQGVVVNWIWTGNLAAYARYFNQRTDDHAQKESQWLARDIGKLIEPLFPHSWKELTRNV